MDIVVGGGRFGVKAAEYLVSKKREFIVLDPDENCDAAKKFKERFIKAKAKDLRRFVEELKPEWIFPTAPIHVAAEALSDNFKPWKEKVNEILAGLPLKVIVSIGKGSIAVSYNRDDTCIQNCSSPEICPVTKIKRPCPMYDLLSFACSEAHILISHQLAPGLGAIRGEDLLEVLEISRKVDKLIVATACKCHGVITALIKSS